MQSVGADDHVESAWRAVLEGDLAVVRDRRDGVGEQIFNVVARGVVEDLAEVVAHDLEMIVGDGRE